METTANVRIAVCVLARVCMGVCFIKLTLDVGDGGNGDYNDNDAENNNNPTLSDTSFSFAEIYQT